MCVRDVCVKVFVKLEERKELRMQVKQDVLATSHRCGYAKISDFPILRSRDHDSQTKKWRTS